MKNLIGVVILAVVCIGLVVALVTTKKAATQEKRKDTDTILFHSNQWEKTRADLEDHKQVIQNLEKDIESRRQQFGELTNKYTEVATKYTDTTATLARTQQSLKATQDEVARRDAEIAKLEVRNQDLDKQAIEYGVALTNLTAQIADTQKKLAASEGDKAFLEKELKRMMAEKADLEQKFNDLAVLRAQVSELKRELSLARRLDWIRKGLFSTDQKGAQQLIQHGPGTPPASEATTNRYDLNVEVNADGSVRVIPPLTNSPAGTAPAPKP